MEPMKLSYEIVINVSYGGFCLDKEMADWLRVYKEWEVSPKDCKRSDYTKYNLIYHDDEYIVPPNDNIEFRMNSHLIECVRTLREKHKNLSYTERRSHKVFSLRVEEVSINIDVDNYYDGKEKVLVTSYPN